MFLKLDSAQEGLIMHGSKGVQQGVHLSPMIFPVQDKDCVACFEICAPSMLWENWLVAQCFETYAWHMQQRRMEIEAGSCMYRWCDGFGRCIFLSDKP